MNSAFGPVAALILALFIAGYIVQSRLPPPKPKIIGIDLGTTYSCVGSYQSVSGNITIFRDKDGVRTIPSIVFFPNGSVPAVGLFDSRNMSRVAGSVVYDGKRFIGKLFDNEDIMKLQRLYPFKLRTNQQREPYFEIYTNETALSISPIEVASIILGKLKLIAEANLGFSIKQAVISVPAEFDNAQRNATIKAGELAGLKVLRLINEPTAAAMAYGLHTRQGNHIIIVIDFGGGTLDVSLLSVQGGMFVTLAMAGNNRFGGQDVNDNLVNYVKKTINNRFGINELDPQSLDDLHVLVEEAKLNLTDSENVLISMHLDAYKPGYIFDIPISRELFNELNEDLFSKLLQPVERVLEEAEMDRTDVHDIVLVGGSTRIPRVRSIIKDHFNKKPNVEIDPDIAVATGVSLQAGIIGGMWPLQVAAIEMPTANIKKIDMSRHK